MVAASGSVQGHPKACLGRSRSSFQDQTALLSKVRGMGLRIIYVTMGSMQVLEPFQVRALFEGLQAVSPRCAVAWSLKSEQQEMLPLGEEALPAHFFIHCRCRHHRRQQGRLRCAAALSLQASASLQGPC